MRKLNPAKKISEQAFGKVGTTLIKNIILYGKKIIYIYIYIYYNSIGYH